MQQYLSKFLQDVGLAFFITRGIIYIIKENRGKGDAHY